MLKHTHVPRTQHSPSTEVKSLQFSQQTMEILCSSPCPQESESCLCLDPRAFRTHWYTFRCISHLRLDRTRGISFSEFITPACLNYHNVSNCHCQFHHVSNCHCQYHRVSKCHYKYHYVSNCHCHFNHISNCRCQFHHVSNCVTTSSKMSVSATASSIMSVTVPLPVQCQ